MTHSNAMMVLIIAATISVGCSSQPAAPVTAHDIGAPIPPIQLRVIDADSGKPLGHVLVYLSSDKAFDRQHGWTDANGEFQLGPQTQVGDKLLLVLEESDPDGTVEAYEQRLRLGAAAATIDRVIHPKEADATAKAIPYGDEHRLIVALGRKPRHPPDPLAQQWISETTYLKRGMSMHEAFSLLVAHGIPEQNSGRSGSHPDCCRSFPFRSDRYPDRYLDLRFRRMPRLLPSGPPTGTQDDYSLDYWEVTNQITYTSTTDPAVWKEAAIRTGPFD